MQSSPSSWPGKGLERIIFFLVFKHPWEAQQKPLGLDAHRRGQDVPCGPRSCARADTTSLRGARAGHELRRPRAAQAPGSVSEQPVLGSTVPPESGGTPEPWERRKGNVPQKRAAWQRRLSGHPSGTACSQLGQRHSEAPSEAITGGRNSDLVQGNSVFPQCCVARAWVV